MVPFGPPSSTQAVAPLPVQLALVAPRAGKHNLRPGPSTYAGYALGRGEPNTAHVAAPPVPKAVKECGSNPSCATYHRLPVPAGNSGAVG